MEEYDEGSRASDPKRQRRLAHIAADSDDDERRKPLAGSALLAQPQLIVDPSEGCGGSCRVVIVRPISLRFGTRAGQKLTSQKEEKEDILKRPPEKKPRNPHLLERNVNLQPYT